MKASIRALTRRPGVSALAILSLALAIGFCTAGFSLIDAFAWRDLPVREPARLARVLVRDREQRLDDLTWVEYQALTKRSRSWDGLVAESRQGPKVRLPDRDDFPITAGVSDNYFDLLGVPAARGDVFHAGGGQDGTVVISDHYWHSALAGDLNILGRTLPVGQASLKIIGVLPPGFTGTNRGLLVDLFVPPATFFGSLGFQDHLNAHYPDFEIVGRLRHGVTLAAAQQDEEAVLRQLQADGQEPGPGRQAALFPFVELRVVSIAILMAPLFLVLLIAAANLANLRLVDNEARRRETGIRLALGAGPLHLLRQHLAETVLLGALGTALGLLLAAWLIDLVPAILYTGRAYVDYGVRLDQRTFGFSAMALLMVAAVGSLIPLSDAWRRRVLPAIQSPATVKSTRWLAALVIVQMGLVTAVTCSAGLLWRSLQNVYAIRPAMDPDRRVLMVQGYWDQATAPASRADTLAGELSTLPGVEHVAYARRALLSGSGGGASVSVQMPNQPKISFYYDQVSPSYFAATGARIVLGRGFRSSDSATATPVTMVNEAFVRRFLAGRDPLGAWVPVDGHDCQIVGVVENGPTIHLKEQIQPYLYFPFSQKPVDYLTFFVETKKNPELLTGSARDLLRRSDASFTLTGMHTLRQHMHEARSDDEMLSIVSGALALLGLVLAAAGLFGVTSYAVSRRTREFGLRMALGARRTDLHRQVLKGAALQALAGIPLGWALALSTRQVMQSALYGVKAGDPWILAAASGLVALVVMLAALRPALAAARVDPIVALRYE